MRRLLLKLIDLAEWPFSGPHDWRIVAWIIRKLTPKHIWDDYGNPLCFAYCYGGVSHFYYRIYDYVARYGD